MRFGSDRAELHIRAAGFDLSFDDVRSVWWRRPLTPHVAEAVTDDRARQFCVRESEALFRGALDATGVPVVNDPAAQARFLAEF